MVKALQLFLRGQVQLATELAEDTRDNRGSGLGDRWIFRGDNYNSEFDEENDFDVQRILQDPIAPEWDILVELLNYSKGFPKCTAKHVKGHQDRNKQYEALSLEAQLNVDADRLANQYQLNHGQHCEWASLMKHTKVQCHLSEGTLTTKWAPALRLEASTPALLLYIRDKNQWTTETLLDVNWTIHSRLLAKRFKQRTHFVKLCHDCLPTNARQFQCKQTDSPWCPLCRDGTPETRDHLIQCQDPRVLRWRVTLLERIMGLCKRLYVDPCLRKILMVSIIKWMKGDDVLVSLPPDISPRYLALIEAQRNIGWRQYFNGRMSTQWDHIQNLYWRHELLDDRLKPKIKGKSLTGEVITLLWDQWLVLWKMRNEAVHGHDAVSRRLIQKEKLNQELHAVYAQRHLMEPRIQRMFFDTAEEHLTQKSESAVHNWLATNQPLFQHSIQVAMTNAISGVRNIQTYFTSRASTQHYSHATRTDRDEARRPVLNNPYHVWGGNDNAPSTAITNPLLSERNQTIHKGVRHHSLLKFFKRVPRTASSSASTAGRQPEGVRKIGLAVTV